MNWSEANDRPQLDQNTTVESEGAQNTLFIGDTGEISIEARRVLVQLLAGPFLDGRRHSKLWSVLLRDERVIRVRLSELFLDLVIDRDLEVAFTRQADVGDLEVPTLLRRVQLTFIDSVLLLYLRQLLIQADAQGRRAVISIDEIKEHMTLYETAANTDRAGFIKRLNASIEKIKKYRILQQLRSTDDRLEISPTLKLLFSAEQIQMLSRHYKSMALATTSSQTEPAESDEETGL